MTTRGDWVLAVLVAVLVLLVAALAGWWLYLAGQCWQAADTWGLDWSWSPWGGCAVEFLGFEIPV